MTPRLQVGEPASRAASGAWLEPLAAHWIGAALTLLPHAGALVRVTVVGFRGSTPREPGATLLVLPANRTVGTIGGGQLEWRASAAARELLRDPAASPLRIDDLILGPHLGQCCGGRVELWLERLMRADLRWLRLAARCLRRRSEVALATEFCGRSVRHRMVRSPRADATLLLERGDGRITLLEPLNVQRSRLWIFGAGHVGQALARLVAELDLFDITWIDPRPELLPAQWPGITTRTAAEPVDLLAEAPAGAHYVVLTHDHALDYTLCRRILQRDAFSWLGLIGSASKAARFRSRLLRDGLAAATVSRLNCPIGIQGIASKLPAAIAIAIAAQLLRLAPAPTARPPPTPEAACTSCTSCGQLRPPAS